MSKKKPDTNPNACIEKGVWTLSPDSPANLVLTPAPSGTMTFHMAGCAGDPKLSGPGDAVAAGMAAQITDPGDGAAVAPSFLYHLGDIAYTGSADLMGTLWNTQFYKQYQLYNNVNGPLPIFAIPGNHDGNTGTSNDTSEIYHFLQNICGVGVTVGKPSPDNQADPSRTVTAQPYPYWRLDTPLAYIIGLYTNVSNGGVLDDPAKYNGPTQQSGPQFQWLVDQLAYCKAQNASGTPRAILLALHYPPYNGTLDFLQRGNPTLGGGTDTGYPGVLPIGMMLETAYANSGQIPDAVFSAHAHLYQRLTVTYTDGDGNKIQQVPHLVAGCGGHTQLELMATECGGGTSASFPVPPFNLFTQGTPPSNLMAPQNATVMVESYYDGTDQANQPYGFLRVTLTPGTATAHPLLDCQFFITPCNSSGGPVNPGYVVQSDSFTLDLATHMLL